MSKKAAGSFEIKNYNFVVPIMSDKGEELKFYVPQPIEKELRSIAHILGYLFTKIRAEQIDIMMFIKDWRIFAEEFCERLENGEGKLRALDAFIERSLLGADIYNECGDKIEKEITAEEREFFEGSLVFMSALYRYSPTYIKNQELGDYFTSLTSTEFKNSLLKSQKTSTAARGVVMRKS